MRTILVLIRFSHSGGNRQVIPQVKLGLVVELPSNH